jgi:acyl-CoA thioester hydrolase
MSDISALQGFRFQRPVKVVFRDIDGMRHVNHAAYVTYLESARNEYWMQLTGIQNVEDFDFVLAELTVRYQAAAKLGDDLIIACRVTELRRSSFLMEAVIVDAKSGKLMAEAHSAQVMYDYERDKTIPIPDERRRQVEEFEGRKLSVEHKKIHETRV